MNIKLAAGLSLAVAVILGGLAGRACAAEPAPASELSQALGQAAVFAGLTGPERAALEVAATVRHCTSGERLVERGRPLDRMFIMLDGQVEVRINGRLVATYHGQTLLGELEFLDRQPAAADVVAVKETRLIEVNNAVLAELMRKQPRIGYVLMGELAKIEAQRLRAMNPE